MKLPLVEYIKTHGLEKTIKDFKLDSRDYPNKVLLKYNMIDSPMDAPEVQNARGIILEKGTWKIMSCPFFKFFNAEESRAAKIDWNSAYVLKKEDGSLTQVYYDWNQKDWFVGTSGMAEAEGNVNNKLETTFASLFWSTIEKVTGNNVEKFKSNLKPGLTYCFELCTPYNIVVTPHGESYVKLLMIRDLNTLEEVTYETSDIFAAILNVPLVQRFSMNPKNAGELMRTFEGMPFSEEGYVVWDGKNRVKIKNPAYVAVHHLKSKTAEYNILEVVKSNEIDEFAATFPERKDEIFKLHANYNKLLVILENSWEELKDRLPKNITPAEKKKYAMAVFEVCEKNKIKAFSGLFFNLKDGKTNSVKEYIREYDNKRLYSIL